MEDLTRAGTKHLELPDVPADDGLAVNEAGSWAHDKLDVVRKYDPAFVGACRRWGEAYYVDGLAGSGVNRISAEHGRLIWGSPTIALRTQPGFTRCMFLEKDPARAAALDHRTAAFADRRVVEQGEVNTHLLPLMRRYVPPKAPVLVVLDPYGMELAWSTVREIANFRGYKWKAEILMLFPINGINRAMHALLDREESPEVMDRFWGDRTWHRLWIERKTEQLRNADQTRSRGLGLYTDKLKNELGYSYAFSKDVRRSGQTGGVKYILVFATDNRTGAKIMNDIFDGRVRGEQLRLDGMPNTMRRDDR
jgi:three-Cys-motif partner protein